MKYEVVRADVLEFLAAQPEDSVDLCLFSPPYEAARSYGIDFNLTGQAWVDWMVQVFRACRRACKGLVACVCEGQTRSYQWSAAPALLMADLHRSGFRLRRPVFYHRVGIPGSGGPDWLRADVEFIICTARPGRLPWSDNTACGHKPKWPPGGPMTHRTKNGSVRPRLGRVTRGRSNGDTRAEDAYLPPEWVNPGNIIHCKVGGGLLGHPLAYENEAPFPLSLAEFFVLSFCPPGGVVCDPFCGSGTTLHAAILHGRSFIGCDVRQSQVDLAMLRASTITPIIPGLS